MHPKTTAISDIYRALKRNWNQSTLFFYMYQSITIVFDPTGGQMPKSGSSSALV